MVERKVFQQEASQLLKELLAIPSVNGKDDESEIAKYIYNRFVEYDIPAEIQWIDLMHANVIARVDGEENSNTIIWNGHMDTVSYGNLDEWETKPFIPVEDGTKLYARGASDMKSGLAAMIYSLITLKKLGIKPIANIIFIGTCDEEKGGLGARKILEENKIKDAKALIIGEPTSCQLGVAQKGCLWLELTVNGKTSHGAYPEEGINAIQYGYEVAARLKNYIESFDHRVLGSSTAQITKIEGGIAPNMTPDICTILMDIRVVPNVSLQMIMNELECICLSYKEATKNKIAFNYQILNRRIPIEVSSENEWVTKFRDTLLEKGLPAKEIGINYFTDASILIEENPNLPVLLFGPGEPNMAHKPNEWVYIDKYYQSIEVLLKIFGGIEL